MVVKTYRGLLANGAQERIPLGTKDGSVGYRIVKFQVVSNNPTGADVESIVAIWKKEQTTIPSTIDFSDNSLLSIAFFTNAKTIPNTSTLVTIFDKEIINQDMFVTAKAGGGGIDSMNYYIELEQMKLDHTQNMSVTLKAIRGSAVD